jgi:hypothetical protein
MFCQNCGSELKDSDKFCTKCGTPTAAVEEPSPEPNPIQTSASTPPPNPIQATEQLPYPLPIDPVPAQNAYPPQYPAPNVPVAPNVSNASFAPIAPNASGAPNAPNTQTPPKSKKSKIVPIIISIAAVLIIAAAVAILVIVKPLSQKAAQEPPVASTSQTDPGVQTDQEPSTALDEETIRNTLSFQFEMMKNPDAPLWQSIVDAESGELEEVGIDTKALLSSWTEGFDYKIGKVTVDGNSATVELTVTCKQLYTVIAVAQNKVLEDESLITLTEEELMARFVETIMDELDKAKPVTTTVIIPFEKTQGVWAETAAAEAIYTNAMMGEG